MIRPPRKIQKTLLSGLTAVSLLVAAQLSGCAAKPMHADGTRRLMESSISRRPDWVIREPESDETYHYFRGIRTGAPSLEAGETDARHNALGKIVEYLGLKVKVSYQRLRTEERTQIEDAIHSTGGAEIFGTRLSAWYFQRYIVYEGGSVSEEHDVYVLIRFPKAAIQQFYDNQAAKVTQIGLLVSSPIVVDADRVFPSLLETSQALEAIEEWNTSMSMSSRVESDVEAIRRKAARGFTRLISPMRLSIDIGKGPYISGPQTTPLVLKASISYETASGMVPMPNVPILMHMGEGASAQEATVTTGTDGVARWELAEMLSTEPTTLTATVALPEAISSAGYGAQIPTASLLIPVQDRISATSVLVLLHEDVDGRPSNGHTVEGRIVAALRNAGITVLSSSQLSAESKVGDPWRNSGRARQLARTVGADIVLTGIASTGPVALSRMLKGVYWCRATLSLQAISVSDGEVITAVEFPNDQIRDTRGFGSDRSAAARTALSFERRGQPKGFSLIAKKMVQAISSR